MNEKVLVVNTASVEKVARAIETISYKLFEKPIITVLCTDDCADTFRQNQLVSSVDMYKPKERFYEIIRLLIKMRKRRYDVVTVLYCHDTKRYVIKSLPFLFGAKRILIFNENLDCAFTSLRFLCSFLRDRLKKIGRFINSVVYDKVLKKIPVIKKLINQRDLPQFVPPGHFYSPIPSLDDIKQTEKNIFKIDTKYIPGIDLKEEKQIKLFDTFIPYYNELPFKENKHKNLRYYFENPTYSYSDAIFLYCMIRHIQPNKIIEVGSGYSSCVMLDTNEIYFDNKIDCTFIEPYPQLLESLINEDDKNWVKIIQNRLQDIEINQFKSLKDRDILFIDSTHVSKINSDVNYIFFHILPNLNSGVYIHFHDIFFPFEYPKEWIYEGRSFNEDYLLRAFLQYNKSFEIVFFNTFLEHFYADKFFKSMPLCMKNPGGSIWIRKI